MCAQRARSYSLHFCNMSKQKPRLARKKNVAKRSLEEKRAQAYEVYMTTDKTQKEIAQICEVGVDTIGEWVNKKGWRQEKAARSVTKEKVISNNLVQILNLQEAINKRENKWPTAAEADTITKLTNTIDTLSGKISLPNYISMFDQFLKFLHKSNMQLAKDVADYTLEFVQTKARELSR
jgi:transposase